MYGPRGSIVSNELPWVGQMPQVENLTMDTGVKFTKPNTITISYSVVVLFAFCLIACSLGTGLLVYHLTTTSQENHIENATVSTYVQEDCSQIFTSTIPPTTSARTIVPKKDVRLPKSVIPIDYRLKIVPYLYENFTFRGEVTISVDVREPTNNITLHINELVIEENSVRVVHGNQSVGIERLEHDQELQFFILYFPRDLSPGKHNVFIKFSGILNNILQGFYRSSYTKNNHTRWIAATQFQSTDARRAFPCFDEPALKATFEVIVGRPKTMSSISNMPKIKSEPMVGEDYVWDYYERSVPMSTYLLAFVVSDFESKSVGNFSVWAREDAINQTLYSLEVGPKILKFYEEYFNIPFPLSKIDLIALPDFSAGAMENWGLITFRESNLLYEENVSSRTNKQSIAIVIAHEIAHQWFGNLVTPSWWTDLWLNEGFASYLEYTGTDSVRSDWKVLDQFVVFELQLVFSLDALKSSHPISIEVNNPDEINDIFDRISYGKGATIIRMMEHFLTTDVFKKGLTNYLNDKKYNSAQQDDLWAALTKQARTDGIFDHEISVKQIMDTWTLQTGFPVVTVTRNFKDNTITFKQEQFSLNGIKDEVLWWIPISYRSNSVDTKHVWMRGQPELRLDTKIGVNDWLLVNVNQTGYYRVNYDPKNWELIVEQLKKVDGHLVFDPKNRAQIVDDALNLASAGYLDYELAMNVTTYLRQEKDFVPWKAAFRGLDYIYEMFVRSGHFGKFKKYILKIILPIYKEIGFKDYPKDPLLTIYVRGEILPRACNYGYKDCIRSAILYFNNWRVTPNPDTSNPIPPNLKSLVYCNAIKFGGEEEWQFAWERYLNTNVGSEKETILAALACTKEIWLLNRYLTMAITEGSGIRKQDAPAVLAGVARNIVGQNLVYKFLTGNWDKIRTYMGTSFISLNGIIRSITLNFNTQQEVDDLKSFAVKRKKDLSVSSRSITQAIEQAVANVKWMDKNFQKIVNWLDKEDESTRR